MTKANTMVVAKMAAAVAAIGLVVSAFAFTANAQSASACASFNRDLTVGASGADVTALQNWLIGKGFTIAAGATGYFGGQTQAALARYQASVSISPAAGYFGPITRAKVGASCGSTDGDTDGDDDGDDSDNDGDLEGGEADLRDYQLNDEESSGAEGEEMVEIATAEFDVEDADVRVERVEVVASSTLGANASTRPWDYFDTLYLLDEDGEELADVDASDRDEWDEGDDDVWTIVFNGVDAIFNEGDNAQLTIAADIASNLDSDDITNGEFEFYIEDEGIRARDGEGIDHYIGDEDETVDFGFDDEETGDLDLSTSADDPDSMTLIADEDDDVEVDEAVFVFNLENEEDVDVLVTDITLDVATSGMTISNLVDDVMLVVDGDEFDGDINDDGTIDFEDIDVVIGGDEELDFEVMVTLAEDAVGTLTFSLDAADVTAESDETGEDTDVSGSADGETHTIALTGIVASNGETTADSDVINTTTGSEEGDFTITFDVEALEEDVYIYKGAAAASSTDAGVIYQIYKDGAAHTSTTTSDNLEANDSDNGDTSDYFIVRSGDTRSFTLEVSINPELSGFYKVELDSIRFDESEDNSAADDEFYTVPDTDEFETDAEQLNA